MTLYVLSDSYIGLDQQYTLTLGGAGGGAAGAGAGTAQLQAQAGAGCGGASTRRQGPLHPPPGMGGQASWGGNL